MVDRGHLAVGSRLLSPQFEQVEVASILEPDGQYARYRVQTSSGEMELVWPHQLPDDGGASAISILDQPTPGRRFRWPIGRAEADVHAGFGYLLPLPADSGLSLWDVIRKRDDVPLRDLVRVAVDLIEALHELRSAGLSVSNLAADDLTVDVGEATVAIRSTDLTIGQERFDSCRVPEFCSPEVLRRESQAGSLNQLHLCAVLTYLLLVGGHPLEGQLAWGLRDDDTEAQLDLYGRQPLFTFNVEDTSNQPAGDDHIEREWLKWPEVLRALWTQVFVAGLVDPTSRPDEIAWRQALVAAHDNAMRCASCGRSNVRDIAVLRRDGPVQACYWCGQRLQLPPRLRVNDRIIVLDAGAAVYLHHLRLESTPPHHSNPVLALVAHPTDPSKYGLQNQSDDVIEIQSDREPPRPLDPGRSVSLATNDVLKK